MYITLRVVVGIEPTTSGAKSSVTTKLRKWASQNVESNI